MPFGKELSHLIEEQINRSVDKITSMESTGNASRSGGDEGRIAQLEANLQRLGEQFSAFLTSQKKSKRNVVDYGLDVIALHELRLAVTAGRATFVDHEEPMDMPYTYLQLSSAGSERQIRYIYLDSTGVILESTTDPTNIGIGYIPLAMVDMWTGITEITQDKIKDIRPRTGAEESNSNAQRNLELDGNVTLTSPDTENDSFVVSATNPAELKINITSGRALVDGEILNAEGGLLDLTSHRNIVKEFIAFSNGTTKTFNLYHKSVSNVIVYVNDVVTSITVDAANGSITFATAPIQNAKITASYTFSGNYMLIFLVEKAQTNDGKSFGVISWKLGTNRTPSEPPDLATYQHAIAKIDMSSSIIAITDGIIDNSYEVKNLTQYDLQYGGKLDGSSLRVGAITGDKIAAQSITGDKIVAGSIDAAKIASGAIQAGHIATGAILIGNLDSTTQNTINRSYSTANTALSNAATAQGTANTAVSNAAAAQTTASSATTLAGTAQAVANTAVTNAATAQSTANIASSNATSALSQLTDISSDNKLTPMEKQVIKGEWDAIVAEKPTVDSQADIYGITTAKTNYGSSYTTLRLYITPLLSSLTTTSDVVGSTLRSNFADYYAKKVILLKNISDSAKIMADTAQTTANTAVSNASVAQGTANAAQTAANSAQASANTANNTINTWRHPSNTTYINGGNIWTGSITASQIAAGTISADKFESTTWGDMSQAMRFVKSILGGSQSWKRVLSSTDLAIGIRTNVTVSTESFPSIKLDTQRHWDDGLTWDNSGKTWNIPVTTSGYWESASVDYGTVNNLQAEFWAQPLLSDPTVSVTVKGRYSNDNVTWTDYEIMSANSTFGYLFWVGSLQSFRYFKIKVEFNTTDTNKYAILGYPEVRAANCQIGTEDITDGSITAAKLGSGALTNNISIISGTIFNGSTLPLPMGYTKSQCKWVVRHDRCIHSNTGATTGIPAEVTVDANTLIANSYWRDSGGAASALSGCQSSATIAYIVIGIK